MNIRSETAYLAVSGRAGRYGIQGATLRWVLVVGLLVLGAHDPSVITVVLLPALLGPVVIMTAALYRWAETPPGLLRWYEDHIARTDGTPALNLTGVLELAGSLLMLTGAALVIDGEPWGPVIALVVAARYLVAVAIAFCTDSAWYNPDTVAPRWQRVMRAAGVPIVLVLVLTAAVVGPNPAGVSMGLTLAVASAAYVRAGVRATDRFAEHADALVSRARLHGQEQVLRELRRSMFRPLAELTARTHRLQPADPALVRLAEAAATRYDRIEAVVTRGVDDDDLADVGDQLVALAGATACALTLDLNAPLEVPADRALAARALQDLVGNALDAGSSRIEARISALNGWAGVEVVDDGPPMPPTGWQAPGTSSASLAAELDRRGGSLTARSHPLGKNVTARWLLDA